MKQITVPLGKRGWIDLSPSQSVHSLNMTHLKVKGIFIDAGKVASGFVLYGILTLVSMVAESLHWLIRDKRCIDFFSVVHKAALSFIKATQHRRTCITTLSDRRCIYLSHSMKYVDEFSGPTDVLCSGYDGSNQTQDLKSLCLSTHAHFKYIWLNISMS